MSIYMYLCMYVYMYIYIYAEIFSIYIYAEIFSFTMCGIFYILKYINIENS